MPASADQQRQRVFFAEQGDARVAAGDVGEYPRQQFYAVQRGAIVAHRDLVLAAAVAELEQRLRQASARHTTQILYIKRLARQIAHALPPEQTTVVAARAKRSTRPVPVQGEAGDANLAV